MSKSKRAKRPKPYRPKGFAAISPERRREIAAMGGRATAASKRYFSVNRVAASVAGAKGGRSQA